MTTTVYRDVLVAYLANLLEVGKFSDYCPNGLQVEGSSKVGRILSAVSANQAAIDAAIAGGYDTLLVHHGWFWRNEKPPIVGIKKKRLKALLGADINLLAYHLPLDAHPVLGNNQALGTLMGVKKQAAFGSQGLGSIGSLSEPLTLLQLQETLKNRLGNPPRLITGLLRGATKPSHQAIRRVAWCTGAAQNLFEEAIEVGAEVFVSGEVSEPCVQLAEESGVAYLACGHHATERDGVKNLGAHLATTFGIEHSFIDLDSGE